LHDISLKGRGSTEDNIYLDNPTIQANIRRGNTILELQDSSLHLLRKGLTKFYDLNLYEFSEE
jgi:hypothetical protein